MTKQSNRSDTYQLSSQSSNSPCEFRKNSRSKDLSFKSAKSFRISGKYDDDGYINKYGYEDSAGDCCSTVSLNSDVSRSSYSDSCRKKNCGVVNCSSRSKKYKKSNNVAYTQYQNDDDYSNSEQVVYKKKRACKKQIDVPCDDYTIVEDVEEEVCNIDNAPKFVDKFFSFCEGDGNVTIRIPCDAFEAKISAVAGGGAGTSGTLTFVPEDPTDPDSPLVVGELRGGDGGRSGQSVINLPVAPNTIVQVKIGRGELPGLSYLNDTSVDTVVSLSNPSQGCSDSFTLLGANRAGSFGGADSPPFFASLPASFSSGSPGAGQTLTDQAQNGLERFPGRAGIGFMNPEVAPPTTLFGGGGTPVPLGGSAGGNGATGSTPGGLGFLGGGGGGGSVFVPTGDPIPPGTVLAQAQAPGAGGDGGFYVSYWICCSTPCNEVLCKLPCANIEIANDCQNGRIFGGEDYSRKSNNINYNYNDNYLQENTYSSDYAINNFSNDAFNNNAYSNAAIGGGGSGCGCN